MNDFGSKTFSFEQFRDEIIKPDYDSGLINHDGATLDEVAEARAIYLEHSGFIKKMLVGDKIWYIRTNKQLPKTM